MDEMYKNPTIRARMEAALNEPSAPQALVERTVARVRAIEAGRDALRRLREEGAALPKKEADTLAATCVVGQLLQSNAPHVNVNGRELAEQLKEVPSFRKLTELPREDLIKKLTDGRTTRSIASHIRTREEPKQQPPVIEAPVKTMPKRSL